MIVRVNMWMNPKGEVSTYVENSEHERNFRSGFGSQYTLIRTDEFEVPDPIEKPREFWLTKHPKSSVYEGYGSKELAFSRFTCNPIHVTELPDDSRVFTKDMITKAWHTVHDGVPKWLRYDVDVKMFLKALGFED